MTALALLNRAIDLVRESAGQPVKLRKLLAEHPHARVAIQEKPASIAMDDVVRWDELSSALRLAWRTSRSLRGWGLHRGHYSSISVDRPEIDVFGQSEIAASFSCDIQDVSGLLSSKNDLSNFECMDEWIQRASPELIAPVSATKLAENLAHRGVRVAGHGDSDYFCRYAWDGRLFLVNEDGSHHFAAARYIAKRIKSPVQLRAPLHTRSIRKQAVESLTRDFEIFLLYDSPAVSNGFHDAMKSMEATWFWHPLPRQYEDCKAVYLPRSESKSMLAANVLRSAGIEDLGRYWSTLVGRQRSDMAVNR